MTTTRRDFLKVLGTSTGAVALACPFVACGPGADVVAGSVDDFDVGLTKVEDKGFLIGRDADGLYAMTALCTHLQCDLSGPDGTISADGIACGCHASTFDLTGDNTGGPASSPLQHYKVEIAEDGTVTVKATEPVDADTRTAIP